MIKPVQHHVITHENEKSCWCIKILSKDLSSLWTVRDDRERIFSGQVRLATALTLCALITVLLISCNTAQVAVKEEKKSRFSQSYTDDRFILEQRISKKEITIAEQLELVLETSVPEEIEVVFPSYSASLGDFALEDTRIIPPRMKGSGNGVQVIHKAVYILEPYLSGSYTIPAMKVTYRNSENEREEAVQLLTDKMEIAVKSFLAPDSDEVAIQDIKPPLAIPPNRTRQFLLLALALLLTAAATAGFIYWKKISAPKSPAEIQPRPEEIALRDLEMLLAENLLQRGETKLFHLRISDILRHYIENRFGLNAPERTTEEFLTELSQAKSSQNALLSLHKVLLADFLTQCDLVKFAKHEPTSDESEKTVMICREFIEKTKEENSFEL